MKRYELYAAHGIDDITVRKLERDNGEWVSADVAQALYDALVDAVDCINYMNDRLGLPIDMKTLFDAISKAEGRDESEDKQ